MPPVAAILLLVERGESVHQGLQKALMLARHFHARLDLFLCDTEGYVQASADTMAPDARTRARCVAEGSDYLQSLRKSIIAPDVEIATEAICHRSLREAVAEKAERTATDLIVKTVSTNRRDAGGRGAADWAAIAACPVPVLLTRGRPWRPIPQFAAALELSRGLMPAANRAIADLAKVLALACGAEVDLLWVGPDRTIEAGDPLEWITRQAENSGISAPVRRSRFLQGAALEVVPACAAERDYDLVVLEKPHLPGAAAALRSVAGSVLASSGGDVVLTSAAAPGARGVSREVGDRDQRAVEAAEHCSTDGGVQNRG
jgi:hypothetical protein